MKYLKDVSGVNRPGARTLFVACAAVMGAALFASNGALADDSYVAGSLSKGSSVQLSGSFPADGYQANLWCSEDGKSQFIKTTVSKVSSHEISVTPESAGKGCCELIMTSNAHSPVLTKGNEIPVVELSGSSCS